MHCREPLSSSILRPLALSISLRKGLSHRPPSPRCRCSATLLLCHLCTPALRRLLAATGPIL
eukprot:2669117-Lingulodinium_polyedra.AAC.1